MQKKNIHIKYQGQLFSCLVNGKQTQLGRNLSNQETIRFVCCSFGKPEKGFFFKIIFDFKIRKSKKSCVF